MRTSDTTSNRDKEKRKDIAELKKVGEKSNVSRRGSKKESGAHTESRTADAVQRDEAVQWASESAPEKGVGRPHTTGEAMERPKVTPKDVTDQECTATLEAEESLFLQIFMAAQYPQVGEIVTPTIRMGRALVSGALGMRTDDPKLFEAAVELPECVVVLQSTKRKAKTPVSAAPPNSIDSEIDGNESGDVMLSQSATHVGVYIELPEGSIDPTIPGRPRVKNGVGVIPEEQTEAVVMTGIIETPVVQQMEVEADTESRNVTRDGGSVGKVGGEDQVIETKIVVGPVAEGSMERQRILQEIDRSKLLQNELIRRDPSLAFVSSFLSTVCGGGSKDKNRVKKDKEQNKVGEIVIGSIPPPIQPRLDARHIEKHHTTQIVAAKSILEEKLPKARPSVASIATVGATAYGDEVSERAESVNERLASKKPTTDTGDVQDIMPSITTEIEATDCGV